MEKIRREKIQVRETKGKSYNNLFFPIFCGSGGSKSRFAKAPGTAISGQMRNEKLHGVAVRIKFWIKSVKIPHVWNSFGC